MKKILFYTMTLSFGGAEKNICALANFFSSNYDVVLVSNIKSNLAFEINEKIKIYQFDNEDKGLNKLKIKLSKERTNKLEEIIKKEKIDLIVAFLPEPSIRALILKKKLNIPVIIGERNNPKSEFKFIKLVRNYYFKRADKIVLQHEGFKEFLPKSLHSKCMVIKNTLEKINFTKNISKNVIINVGRLEKSKNQKLLIKAFYLLEDKYKNLELHIYGEGKLRTKLQKLINKLDLTNKVFIHKNNKNIKQIIATSKLFVLSSKFEGMPNVVLEALMLKTKVVSTNCTPVIKDLIKKEFISKSKPSNLARTIEYALNNKYEFNLKVDNEGIYKSWEDLIKELL